MIVGAVITGLTGLILILLGYLIKVRGMANLIAGYDPKKVQDKKGLTGWVGGGAMLIGAVLCLRALFDVWWSQSLGSPLPLLPNLLFVALLLVLSGFMAYKASKY